MNRNWPVMVIAALLTLFVARLHAEGLYLGAAIGKAGIKDHISTETFDSDDAAYKAFVGWRFKVPVVNFAIEGAYTDFGKPSQTLGTQKVETRLHGPSLAGLAILPLGPIDFYGKAGVLSWSADTTIGGATTGKSGTDAFYGAGIGLNLGPLGLRAEYERFQIKDVDRVDLLSVSALFQF